MFPLPIDLLAPPRPSPPCPLSLGQGHMHIRSLVGHSRWVCVYGSVCCPWSVYLSLHPGHGALAVRLWHAVMRSEDSSCFIPFPKSLATVVPLQFPISSLPVSVKNLAEPWLDSTSSDAPRLQVQSPVRAHTRIHQ